MGRDDALDAPAKTFKTSWSIPFYIGRGGNRQEGQKQKWPQLHDLLSAFQFTA